MCRVSEIKNCCPFLFYFLEGKIKDILNEKLNDGNKIAMRVSKVSIFISILLSVIKLGARILANSGAMISDVVHSVSDIFSIFIVIIGVKMGEQNTNKKHQYGHEKIDCIVAIFLLGLIELGIVYEGSERIEKALNRDLPAAGILALIAVIFINSC